MLDRIKILEVIYGLQGNPEYMSKIMKKHSYGANNDLRTTTNKAISQNNTSSYDNNLSTKAVAENILKIKINDQDYDESLLGDNTSSYVYAGGNLCEELSMEGNGENKNKDLNLKKTRSIL